jgi:hypothetical protein
MIDRVPLGFLLEKQVPIVLRVSIPTTIGIAGMIWPALII